MSEQDEAEAGKASQSEDCSLPISSPTALQAAAEPVPDAVESTSPSESQPDPSGWVFTTFFILSIVQLMFMALSIRYWAFLLQYITSSRGNPIKYHRVAWIHEVLSMTALFLVLLFYALTSGLGVYVGASWQKAKQNTAVLDERVCCPCCVSSCCCYP